MNDPTPSPGRSSGLSPLFSWRSALVESDLSSTDRLVALVLSLHMSERGDTAFPFVQTIADEAGVDRRTAQRSLRSLLDGGWLVLVERGGMSGARRRSNTYQAAIPARGGETPRAADDRPEGRRETAPGAADDRPLEESVLGERPPEGESGSALARAESPRAISGKVDRRPVTEAESRLAALVLVEWNRQTGQDLRARDWLAKIVMRIREHPGLDVEAHAAVIVNALAKPWWSGPPTPSVVYGSGAQFERSLVAWRTGNAGGREGVTAEQIARHADALRRQGQ